MTDKEARGAQARVPLTDAELAELVRLYEGGMETALEWRAAALAAHPFLLAEVREGRKLLRQIEWGLLRDECPACGGPMEHRAACALAAFLQGNAAEPPPPKAW